MQQLMFTVIALVLGVMAYQGITPSAIATIQSAKVAQSISREEAIIDQIRRYSGNTGSYPASITDLINAGYLREQDNSNGLGGSYTFTVDAAKGLVSIDTTIADDAARASYLTHYTNKWKPVDIGSGVLRTVAVLPSTSNAAMTNPGAQAQAVSSSTAPDAATNTYWWDTSGSTAVLKVSNGATWSLAQNGSGSGSSGSGVINVDGSGLAGLATSLPKTGNNGDIKYIADTSTGVATAYVYYNGNWFLYGTASSGATVSRSIQPSASSIDFGNTPKNSTKDLSVTYTNSNAVVLTNTAASTTGSQFSIVANTCGTSVAAYASCSVTVRFTTGTTLGATTGTLSYGGQIISLAGVVINNASMVSYFARNAEAIQYNPKSVPLANGYLATFTGTSANRHNVSLIGSLNTISWSKGWSSGATNCGLAVDSAGRNLVALSTGTVYATDSSGNGVWQWPTSSFAAASGCGNTYNVAGNLLAASANEANVAYLVAYTSPNAYVYKINSATGAVVWRTTLTSSSSIQAQTIAATADGGVIVAGVRNSTITFVAKVASDGSVTWQRDLSLGTGYVTSIDTDSTGNVYIGGTMYSGSAYSGFVAKLTTTGAYVWNKAFGSSSYSTFVKVTSSGIAVGQNGLVFLADASTGSTVWAKSVDTVILWLTADTNSNVVIHTKTKYLIRITADTGGLNGSFLSSGITLADTTVPAPVVGFLTTNNPGGMTTASGSASVTPSALATSADAALVISTETAGY